MVAAAMSWRRGDYVRAAACIAAIIYVVAMYLAGEPWTHGNRVESEVAGLLELEPARIVRIDVIANDHMHTFERGADGWRTPDGDDHGPVGPPIETALGLLHRAAPIRMLAPEQTAGVSPAAYGFAPPALTIRLATDAAGETFNATFGNAVNDGRARYLRLHQRAEIWIVSGFVYDAWQTLMH